MKKERIYSSFILLLAAAIWGFAFVAQKIGMRYVGPFTFNGVRFLLGAIVLIPFLKVFKSESQSRTKPGILKYGFIAGVFLFLGSSFQQIGILYTTAGKAGFITGLYIVFVPIIGIFVGQKIGISKWLAVLISFIGLYLLSVKSGISIGRGDLLVLIGSFFWAFHVQLIGHIANKFDTIKFAIIQFFTNSVISLIAASLFETIKLSAILNAYLPILYAGILSVGVAYTLQIFGQKRTEPTVSALILETESVFSVIGGGLILNEILNFKEITGCVLMLFGIIISQIDFKRRKKL